MTAGSAYHVNTITKEQVGRGQSITKPEHAKYHLTLLKRPALQLRNNRNQEIRQIFRRLLSGNRNLISGINSVGDERAKYVLRKALELAPANRRTSFLELLRYYNVGDVINFKELFQNFTNDTTFRCIRLGGQEKTHNGGPCKGDPKKAKGVKQAKDKKITSFKNFQNQIQIVVNHGGKEHDFKLFGNGRFTLTGCNNTAVCQEAADMLFRKINDTTGATSHSELSEIAGRNITLDVRRYAPLKYTLFKTSAATNLVLHKSNTDPHGLRQIYNLLSGPYRHLLPKETHPGLKPKNMPIKLNAPQLPKGKTLMFKLVMPAGNNNKADPEGAIISVHLGSKKGTLTVFASGVAMTEYAYRTLAKVFNKHFKEISN